jgi:hypothetical protein
MTSSSLRELLATTGTYYTRVELSVAYFPATQAPFNVFTNQAYFWQATGGDSNLRSSLATPG